MNQRINRHWIKTLLWAGFVAVFGMGVDARADFGAAVCETPGIRGGGGEVPSPFSTLNQRVELADGEFYTLFGKVVASTVRDGSSIHSHPALEVDLKEHPWLATVARKQDPTYSFSGGWGFWGKYLQKRVKVTVQARGMFIWGQVENDVRYVIGLKQLENVDVQVMDIPIPPPASSQ